MTQAHVPNIQTYRRERTMSTNHAASFGVWLKAHRDALGLTQKEVAVAAACSVSTLRKIEASQRRPSMQVAELLAACLEIPPEEHDHFIRFARDGGGGKPPLQLPSVPHPSTLRTPHSALRTPTNLPAPISSFVGRAATVSSIRELLGQDDVRLLTLTGPPGIGKTRLATEVATLSAESFPDGVFMVPLAPVSDPPSVATTIARTLGLRDAQGASPQETLESFARGKQLLLFLDNFEQVLEAGPTLTSLLRAGPGPKIIVTSRIPLRLYGEHEFPVPPLDVPPAGDVEQPALAGVESMQLFVRRAQAARAGFALDGENAAPVARLCSLLEGLPLAIELAAARVAHMQPPELLDRLSSQGLLGVLASEMRDLTPRQKTLRGAIAWSYDLLDDSERQLFRQLGVFVGGFTPDAAEAVWDMSERAGGAGGTPLDTLLLLADTSLLRREAAAGAPRFGMLETVREYALEQVAASGEEEAAREMHARYFVQLAEQQRQAADDDERIYLDSLEGEHANLLAALAYLVRESAASAESHRLSLRLAKAMSRFWYVRDSVSEGRRWLLATLEDQGGEDDRQMRADVLKELGTLDWLQGDFPAARASYTESFNISKLLGDRLGIAKALNNLGNLCNEEGDLESARRYYEESLALAQELGQEQGITRILNNLGTIAHKQGAYADARRYYEESLAMRRRIGDKQGIALILNNLGAMLGYLGELDEARAIHVEAQAIGVELNSKAVISRSLVGLADVALDEGDILGAWGQYKESLILVRQVDYKVGVAEGLEGLARVALAVGEPYKAALLCGLADNVRNQIQSLRPLMDTDRYERVRDGVIALLSEAGWKDAWRIGSEMPAEEVNAYAAQIELSRPDG